MVVPKSMPIATFAWEVGEYTRGFFRVFWNPCRGTVPALLVDDKAILTDQHRKFVYVLGAGDTT